MESIISNIKKCVFCNSKNNLQKHHIMHGSANRKIADKYGCWCYLCVKCHTGSKHSVHHDSRMDTKLKIICQKEFEKIYSHEKWMALFGRNYL